MNEINQKVGDALRTARSTQSLTAVASDQHKALNAAIRSKAQGSVTVEAGKRPQAPQAAETGKDTATGATTQPEPPKAPQGNAGNGAGQAGIPAPLNMNAILRAGRYIKSDAGGGYLLTGKKVW